MVIICNVKMTNWKIIKSSLPLEIETVKDQMHLHLDKNKYYIQILNLINY